MARSRAPEGSRSVPSTRLGGPRAGAVVATLVLVLGLWGSAATVLGQSASAIEGVVKDSSGAVMPGVTIEASSPALIEGSRTAVTDGSGRYRIINLRAGTYTVTFTLSGFSTLKRENIVVPAAFTATVDGQLSVGAVQESVTVTTAAPLVDVQNSVTNVVMNREILDSVPTGKDPFGVGQLIPGITTATPDVGGTQLMQQPTLQVHGSSNLDNVFMVDGVQIQHMGFSGNQTGFYYNDGLMQDISYQTSSLPAEAAVGGVQINMIPKEGGNEFRGSFFGTGANSQLQSNNNSTDYVSKGYLAQNKIKNIYDLNFTIGGPVVKDRLWFLGTYRRWASNNYLGNTFTATGEQALDDQRLDDATLRLTLQLSKRNKIAAHLDRAFKWRGHRPNNWISASVSNPTTAVEQKNWLNYQAELKWTSTVTDRLLVEAAVFSLPVYYNLWFRKDAAPDARATVDSIKSIITGVSPREDHDSAWMYTYNTSATYVTGSHSLKIGGQLRKGWSEELFFNRGDIVQYLQNGVPNSVRLLNTPSGHLEEGVNLGVFVQDSWRFKRLTLNPGVRYERFLMSIPEQGAPAGTWVGARSYQAQNNIVKWNTVSPRFGFSWDAFGDGRTAVKGGVSRYDRLEGVTIIQPLNRRNLAFQTCPWTDTNGDFFAQNSEIAFSRCSGSLEPTLGQVDSNLKRPHQWEYTVMVQRQIGSNTSVSVGYYRRRFSDLYTTVNAAVPATSYTAATITNPLTSQSMTVYNQDPATRGKISNRLTTIPSLKQTYNGVEFQVNTRLRQVTVFGGLTIGRNYGDQDSGDLNNPNNLINNQGNVGYDSAYQIRAGFICRLPAGVQFSGSIRESQGLPQARTYIVTTAMVPGLTQVTQSIQVAPRGEYRYPWQNLVDLRMTKVFRLAGGVKFEPTIDLYNIFNSNAVTSANTTVGSSLGKPSAIVMGRLLRLGAHVSF